jgi:hypothetical protein
MSRVAMFEGIRRRKGRKSKKAYGRKRSRRAYGVHTPKAKPGQHWRLRKTRKDAGHKGGKTPAQKIFAKAASSCPYPKSGSAKQRRSAYNNCIAAAIKRLQKIAGYKPGKGKYRVK